MINASPLPFRASYSSPAVRQASSASQPAQETAPASPPPWAPPSAAAEQAISRFNLRRLGWMGFDQLSWVTALKSEKPEAFALASSCSAHRPEYEQRARDLFATSTPDQRQALQNYFVGKLGLEELSCRMSGAGAGMCDKRTAYMKIVEISQEFVV